MRKRNKREEEKRTVEFMIRLYCRKNHGRKEKMCPECQSVCDYAKERSDLCPFMENKTFCVNCTIHCYKAEMRDKICKIMRFSGPRMMFYHPLMGIRHLIESKKEKRRKKHTDMEECK